MDDLILNPEKLEFHAACPDGLIQFLQEEADSFRLKVLSSNRGGIHFKGREENLYNFFLSTRFSSRIGFVFHRARVRDADELYQVSSRLPWEVLIPKGKTFRIDSFTKDNLQHSQFALYRLKDSIKDRLRNKRNYEIDVAKDSPDVLILLRSSQNEASIQISLSPQPLHKRGYRLNTLEAPIRETIAQALLAFSGWNEKEVLIDPMCGSGTILIEAALLKNWNGKLNYQTLSNSFMMQRLFGTDLPKPKPQARESIKIFGFDNNPRAISIAKENARKAGVEHLIQFEEANFLNLKPKSPKGFLVTNPPYGVRLGEKDELKELYFGIGKTLKDSFSGHSFTLISGDKSLLGHFRLKAEKELSLSIAQLKGKLVHYLIQ
jgi:23S rRNA G2445 N2-methylase RlmL